MKLILAIIQDNVEEEIVRQLAASRYRATRVASTGGFLRRGNLTLLIGVEEERLDDLIHLMHEACDTCRSEAPQNPAQNNVTLFILNAKSFQQI